jgi:hypothetical protein
LVFVPPAERAAVASDFCGGGSRSSSQGLSDSRDAAAMNGPCDWTDDNNNLSAFQALNW